MKELQSMALAYPLARADQILDSRHFRRIAGGWAVGLSVNK